MGGGDLNLKKSWHPSTMKNMEKVWKAEQQDHQEKKRIAELKREIEMEKDKEDMTKYAMDQGVIEKKEDKKLDWMYKGPNQMVNREDYLLGKPIDKPFEKMVQAEKDGETNRVPKNHVEYECIPPSLRFFSGSEQVDLARKLQEDPLYAIKKKEMETRSQLLKNPVRLKQLRDLLEQQSKKDKSDKRSNRRKKKKRSKSSSAGEESEGDDGDLDNLLAKKYKKLKGKINEDYLMKSMKRLKNERKKRGGRRDSSSDDTSDSSDKDEKKRRLKRKRGSSNGERDRETRKKECKKKQSERSTSNERASKRKSTKKRKNSDSGSLDEKDDSPKKGRKNHEDKSTRGSQYGPDRSENREKSPHRRDRASVRGAKESDDEKPGITAKVNFGLMRADRTRVDAAVGSHESSRNTTRTNSKDKKREEKRWLPQKKSRLTEKEMEERRREMMENAFWRDRERENNVKRYREQEKKEQPDKAYNKDFIRKQLAAATEVGSIESRIRANINNIQRSGRAMDTNFAKR